MRVEDVAEAFGVSPQSVYSWERGVTRPQPVRFAAIERAYQLAPGTIASMLGQPLSGSPLQYWVTRWDQVTADMERATRAQRELLAMMREQAINPRLVTDEIDTRLDEPLPDATPTVPEDATPKKTRRRGSG